MAAIITGSTNYLGDLELRALHELKTRNADKLDPEDSTNNVVKTFVEDKYMYYLDIPQNIRCNNRAKKHPYKMDRQLRYVHDLDMYANDHI